MALASRRIGTPGPGSVELFGKEKTSSSKKDDDGARIEAIRTMIYDASTPMETFREKVMESYRYIGGEQWADEDLEVLKDQKRPALTINKILAPINSLRGLQRQSRVEPSFAPFEAGDARASELIRGLYKYHGLRCREAMVDSQVFTDKLVAGVGYWKLVTKFDNGDIEGRPAFVRRHPLSIFPDPNFWDGGRDAMRYCVDAIWMTKAEAIARYPELEDEITARFGEWMDSSGARVQTASTQSTGEAMGDSLAQWRFFWDPKEQRCRIAETWEVELKKVPVAVMDDGQVEDDETIVAALKAAAETNPDIANSVAFSSIEQKRVRVSHLLDDILLDDGPSPWDEQEIPIFESIAYFFWKYPFGPVETMKSPQAELNRRRSTITEMVQKMPNSGFLNKEEYGAKTEDIEKYATGNGAVINYREQPPQVIKPPELPQTLIWLDQQADKEIRSIPNITDEMMGATTQKTVSGRAIEARQRSSATSQEPLIESFREDKEPAAAFMVRGIQQYVSIGKAMRILGSIAQREGSQGNLQAATQDQQELARLLEDAMIARYDIIIKNDQPFEPSLKVQNYQTLVDLAASNPNLPPPPQIMVRAAKAAGVIQQQDADEWLAAIEQQMAAAQAQAQGGQPVG